MNIVEELAAFITSKARKTGLALELVKLETRLAGLGFMRFAIFFTLFLMLTLVLWLVICTTIGYGIYLLTDSVLIVCGVLILLHIALCTILIIAILKNLRRMSFAETRKFFTGTENEQVKRPRSKNPRARKRIAS